jgi:hypothetical protein
VESIRIIGVCKSPVDHVGTPRNRIVAGLQTTRDMSGIGDPLQVAMRRRAEACIQAAGGHMEHLL